VRRRKEEVVEIKSVGKRKRVEGKEMVGNIK